MENYYTEYVDGVSAKVIVKNGEVTSNNERMSISETLKKQLSVLGKDVEFRGVLVGEGIGDNPYGLGDKRFMVYDLCDITNNTHFDISRLMAICEAFSFEMVPFLGILEEGEDLTVDEISKLNENINRKGVVLRSVESEKNDFVFKI